MNIITFQSEHCSFATDKLDLAQAYLDVLNQVISPGEFFAYAISAYPGLTNWVAMVASCFGTAI